MRPATSTFAVFGGTAVVAVTDASALPVALAAVRRTAADFDSACSRFREDSELAEVCRQAGRAVPARPVLIEAVTAALYAAEISGGRVDPTVGAALIALGYDRDLAEVNAAPAPPRPAPRVLARSVPGWRTVEVDTVRGTVRIPRGARLVLDATAKALAADRAAEAAHADTGAGVLVSFSGDLAIVGAPPANGWPVRVADDHRAGLGKPGQTVTLRDSGLATSSTQVRRWMTDEGPVHHLLDPATGAPAIGVWRTVTVAAATCLEANIASTTALLLSHAAPQWLQERRLPARLVGVDGRAVHLGGWPTDAEDLAAPRIAA